MTYGQLKLRLTQAFPSISLDLIEGWVNDRYQEILGELPWFRENIQAVLETSAPYTTGTVSVVQGSSNLTLTGGAWDASVHGVGFRVTGQPDYYEFSATSPTTGLLERAYDGPTADGAAYSLFQFVFPLPANCQMLEDDAFCSRLGEMKRFTHEQLNALDPTKGQSGTPQAWASYMDDDSVPPRTQVEVWPIPSAGESLLYTYQSYADDLTAETTILQLWMQPTALVEGVTARIKAQLKDYTGAAYHSALAKSALATMRGSEAQSLAPGSLELDDYYTRHRLRRGYR